MTQLLSADGAATATDDTPVSLITRRSQRMTAAGTATAFGRASALSRLLPSGGLTDYGVWATGQPDTAMTRDVGRLTGADTTAARGWLAATAPVAYSPGGTPLWNAAAYAGIGIKWASMPNAQKQAYHQVQMERTDIGNKLSWEATSWEGRPCYTAHRDLNWCTITGATDIAFSGHRSGKITYTGAPGGTSYYWINPTFIGMGACTAGERLSGSVALRMTRAAWWMASLQFYDASYVQIGSAFYYNSWQQHPGNDRWDIGFVYNVTAPAGAVWVAVVPRISINSTPSATDGIAPVGEVAYCDMNRVWPRQYNILGTPSAYASPRKLTIDVKANRVNLVNNPSFGVDTKGWGQIGIPNGPYPISRDVNKGRQKLGAMKFAVAANVGSLPGTDPDIGAALIQAWNTAQVGGFGWKASTTYTVSAYVRLGPKCPTVYLDTGYVPVAGVVDTAEALADHPELIEGEWIRLWQTFVTSETDNGFVTIILRMDTADVTSGELGVTFWVDDVLCEEGDKLRPYFDGDTPGSDYLWAGPAGFSSSHYYRDYRSSAYRLRDIVRGVVPHGTQINIRYAQPPR